MSDPSRRAVGIVRVSNARGREGESFASPEEQRARIEAACERDGLSLVAVHEELDVSGGRSLEDRPGLGAAVAAVEAGAADVVAAAYFDRLFRSLTTQAEVVERVERAGGQVLAVDVGRVTNGSAGQWLSGTMLGAVSEYYRRSIKERSGMAQTRAVDRGAAPIHSHFGYLRKDDGTLVPDPVAAPLVAAAFEIRANGGTVRDAWEMLEANGWDNCYTRAWRMLKNRIYLGELHFGGNVNLTAHDPIVSLDVWQRAQRTNVIAGRKSKSERLLARLGVLICGSCGGRLVVTSTPGHSDVYRCGDQRDRCRRRVAISAPVAEKKVSDEVRAALQDTQGRASIAESAQEAVSALEAAQSALDSFLRVFDLSGAEDESAVIERITTLREARDAAQAHLDQIGLGDALVFDVGENWEDAPLVRKRSFIKAAVVSAIVAPGGRGPDRITVRLRGKLGSE